MLCISVLICSLTLVVGDQDKWVWGTSRRNSEHLRGEYSVARPVTSLNSGSNNRPLFKAEEQKLENKYRDEPIDDGASNRPRYEVFEGDGDLNSRPPPPSVFQSRPPPGGFQSRPPPPGGFQSRPPPQLGFQSRPPPLPIHPDDRPINRPLPPPGLGHPLPPLGQSQGNHHAPGILTGPVPSWEHSTPFKNNDPTNFDQCKCVHSFNCKSPGLKFSSCDAGKTYCCYNNEGYGLQNLGSHGAFGTNGRPGDHGPAVLVGPGGPNFNQRPDFIGPSGNRPFPPPPGPGRPPFLDRPDQNLGPVPFDYLERSAKRKQV